MAKSSLDLTQEKDQHIDERLRSDAIIWLSTVRPDGRPHIVAVWFLWDGESILIFSIADQQKVRNVQSNPNVALALDNSAVGEDAITIEGKAELLPNGTVDTTLPAYVEKYDALLKDMNWTGESMAKRYSQAIRITPTRFLSVT